MEMLRRRTALPRGFWQQALLAQMAVAEITGVPLGQLSREGHRDARTVFARHAAMYLCRHCFSMTAAEIARVFGRDHSTVRHALLRIGQLRQEPEVDRTLQWLETSLCRTGGFYG
jgi:chromosomal replication initiation ATPase DnaA